MFSCMIGISARSSWWVGMYRLIIMCGVRGMFLISMICTYGKIILGVAIFCRFRGNEWFS
jgi:hypothetical protein